MFRPTGTFCCDRPGAPPSAETSTRRELERSGGRFRQEPQRRVIAPANDTGRFTWDPTSSATPADTSTSSSRIRASPNSRKYSGFPPPCSASRRNRGPGAAATNRPTTSTASPTVNGAKVVTTVSGPVKLARSAASSGRIGTVRQAATSNNGN
jgi:hypothetical protein